MLVNMHHFHGQRGIAADMIFPLLCCFIVQLAFQYSCPYMTAAFGEVLTRTASAG